MPTAAGQQAGLTHAGCRSVTRTTGSLSQVQAREIKGEVKIRLSTTYEHETSNAIGVRGEDASWSSLVGQVVKIRSNQLLQIRPDSSD